MSARKKTSRGPLEREGEPGDAENMYLGHSKAGTVALRRQMLGEPHNSLWLMARGSLCGRPRRPASSAESPWASGHCRKSASSQRSHTGSVNADPTGFFRNQPEQGELNLLHKDDGRPGFWGYMRQGHRKHRSAPFYQKCPWMKGHSGEGVGALLLGSIPIVGWYRGPAVEEMQTQVSGSTGLRVPHGLGPSGNQWGVSVAPSSLCLFQSAYALSVSHSPSLSPDGGIFHVCLGPCLALALRVASTPSVSQAVLA